MKLVIEIDMENDAFRTNRKQELTRVIHDGLRVARVHSDDDVALRDSNGNTVGSLKVRG